MITGRMVYYIAFVAIVSSLIISGCVSAPPPATPTPTTTDKVTIKGTVAFPSATKGSRLSELPLHDSIAPSVINKNVVENTFLALGMPMVASASSSRWTQWCDPFPCKRVSNTPVRIVKPSSNGWSYPTKYEPSVSGTTDSNGDFSITVDKSVVTSTGPVFIAALNPDGTINLMSTIPSDLILAGATIELAVDRTTTAAAVMHCSGGVYPPPRGGWCYSDPQESTNLERLYAKIDIVFANNPSTTTEDNYLSDVTTDPDVLNTFNQILSENNLPSVSAQQIMDEAVPTGGVGITNPEPTITPRYTTPRPTSSTPRPTSQPPLNLPSGFPTNLPTGAYSLTMRMCIPGYGCSDNYIGTITNTDIYEFSKALTTALNQAASQCGGPGTSCALRYSAFNGKSFTATYTITVCVEGSCSSSTIDFIISKA